jgi:hypothetical protein
MTDSDSIDVAIFALKRHCPSKGFNISVFPGAPFGPEVVLSLREEAGAADAAVVTEHEGEVNELSFVKLERGAAVVLLDMETAREIGRAVDHFLFAEAHAEES